MLGLTKRRITEDDLLDLHGKVAIVTGANTGIGYSTVQFLARKGAKVYLAARDEGRVAAAIENLKWENIEDGSLHWLKLDLSDPCNGKLAAEEFLKQETRLDILVNNAARATPGDCELNKDGLLDIMVVNHITPFAFTEALLPILKQTARDPDADVRIVNVSSIVHTQVSLKTWDKATLNKFYGTSFNQSLKTYGNTKLANILHAKELQRRFDTENIPITCLSLHPGKIKTASSVEFAEGIPILGPFAGRFIVSAFLAELRDGAQNVAFAAASKVIHNNRANYKGAYLLPVAKLGQPSESAQDTQLSKELYDLTETILNELR